MAVVVALTAAACGEPAAEGEDAVVGQDAVASLPAFDPSSAVGRYVPGFPQELLPVPASATLLATSAQPSEGSVPPQTQITMNLTSSLTPQEVLDQFAASLGGQGFAPVEAPDATGLTAQAAYTRQSPTDAGTATESLLVGILDDGARRLVTVTGTVLAPAAP